MWIELGDAVLDYITKNGNYNDNLMILENILFSMRRKQHIIYMPYTTMEKILSLNGISDHNKEYIIGLYDHRNELYSIRNDLQYRVSVIPCGDIYLNKNVFYVPFNCMKNISQSRLLVENESDGHFYNDLVLRLLSEKRLYNYTLSLEIDSFSGSGADRKIKELSGKGMFLYCIADTDKSFAQDEMGSSYKNAYSEYNKIKNNNIIYFFEMNYREKENWIPPQLYIFLKKDLEGLLSVFNNKIDKYRYFDIKDGIKMRTIRSNKWKAIYNQILLDLSQNGLCKYDLNDTLAEDNKICICGIGDKIAEKVDAILIAPEGIDRFGLTMEERLKRFCINRKERNKYCKYNKNILMYVDSGTRNEWEKIYLSLFPFGCALDKYPGILSK